MGRPDAGHAQFRRRADGCRARQIRQPDGRQSGARAGSGSSCRPTRCTSSPARKCAAGRSRSASSRARLDHVERASANSLAACFLSRLAAPFPIPQSNILNDLRGHFQPSPDLFVWLPRSARRRGVSVGLPHSPALPAGSQPFYRPSSAPRSKTENSAEPIVCPLFVLWRTRPGILVKKGVYRRT